MDKKEDLEKIVTLSKENVRVARTLVKPADDAIPKFQVYFPALSDKFSTMMKEDRLRRLNLGRRRPSRLNCV